MHGVLPEQPSEICPHVSWPPDPLLVRGVQICRVSMSWLPRQKWPSNCEDCVPAPLTCVSWRADDPLVGTPSFPANSNKLVMQMTLRAPFRASLQNDACSKETRTNQIPPSGTAEEAITPALNLRKLCELVSSSNARPVISKCRCALCLTRLNLMHRNVRRQNTRH
jgi:hypothetical protein